MMTDTANKEKSTGQQFFIPNLQKLQCNGRINKEEEEVEDTGNWMVIPNTIILELHFKI